MLKKLRGLFLGLVVFAGSACVTPTHASSASVVLTHVQAASPQSAKDEMIAIYNNSSTEVNISGWCLTNKSNISFACFETGDPTLAYYLPPYSHAVAATESFVSRLPVAPESVTVLYEVTNQSSGSLVNSSDVVTLIDADGETVDTYSWSTSIPSGKVALRLKSASNTNVYETLDPLLSWSYGLLQAVPLSQVEVGELGNPELPPDDPENPGVPVEPETPEESNEETNAVTHPIISEILPNPSGSDTNNEFIELFNPDATRTLNLSEYTLKVGRQLEKTFAFPAGSKLAPYEYKSFFNDQVKFTLLNSTSKVQLAYKGQLIGEAVAYDSPEDGAAWVRMGNAWSYTNTPTPDLPNQLTATEDDDAELAAAANNSQKPCAANQYRSPETNRCRLVATATSTLKECTEGQYRSLETNRCRNISSNTLAPTPCKTGQERNPETNRCRNIVKMTDAGYDVKGLAAESKNEGVSWYLWLAIGGVVLLIAGYGVWEWREELAKLWNVAKTRFARTRS